MLAGRAQQLETELKVLLNQTSPREQDSGGGFDA